jgi:hypothetical protein
MPGIKPVKLFSVSNSSDPKDAHGDDINNNTKGYCPSCLRYGIRSPLKKRMLKVEQTQGQGQEEQGQGPKLVPATVPDADRFRQCHRCGDIVPLYNVKTESKIEDFVEPIDNPFDMNPGNMDGFTPGIGKSNRLNKSKSIYKRKKEQISKIKDEDVRKELAQGNVLTSYFEQVMN